MTNSKKQAKNNVTTKEVTTMNELRCPKCGEKLYVFGKSNLNKTAEKYGIKNTARIPIDSTIGEYADGGEIEEINADLLNDFFNKIK